MRMLPFLVLAVLAAGCGADKEEGPWTVERIDAFTQEAVEELRAKQDKLQRVFRLGEWERYDWDQDTGVIVFSQDGVPKLEADILFVGSTSTVSDTWLWSWANKSIDKKLSEKLKAVRDFGKKHGIERLTKRGFPGDEHDGWSLTAVAAKLLEAQGAYRSPGDKGASFLLLFDARWVK